MLFLHFQLENKKWLVLIKNIDCWVRSLNLGLVQLNYEHWLRKRSAGRQAVCPKRGGIAAAPVINNVAFARAPEHAHHRLLQGLWGKHKKQTRLNKNKKDTEERNDLRTKNCRDIPESGCFV